MEALWREIAEEMPINNINKFLSIITNIPENIREPYEFFKLFITDNFLETICKYTNDYADYKKTKKIIQRTDEDIKIEDQWRRDGFL